MTTLSGVSADELMSHPAISMAGELTLAQAQAQAQFARYRYTAFPVTDRAGRALGMISIDHLEQTPPSRSDVTVVADLAERDPALLIGERDVVAQLLNQPAFARVATAAVVDDAGGSGSSRSPTSSARYAPPVFAPARVAPRASHPAETDTFSAVHRRQRRSHPMASLKVAIVIGGEGGHGRGPERLCASGTGLAVRDSK